MPAADRRSELRYVCNGTVRIDHPEAFAIQPGRIVDLSLGGCMVLVPHPEDFRHGEAIELTILMKGTGLRVRGIARHGERPERLMGIDFRTMTVRARTDLVLLIEELESEMEFHSVTPESSRA